MFRASAAVLSSLLVLGLLEVSLRLAGYGYPSRAIVRYRDAEFDGYVDNVKFSWRFFHRNLAREFEPFTMPAAKSPGTYRIFVCGSSAAQGVPDGSYAFARVLEVMLRHSYPDLPIEVINTGMTAINSHVVLPIVKDCARHEPDLLIIYTGNNEVVGPYGPGTVFAPMAESLWPIRAGIALKATRTGQLLDAAGASVRGDGDMQAWGGMQMFLERQVRLGDSAMSTVYSHFRRNLEGMREAALRAGASVIFCTVGSNLRDCPPFASLHRPDIMEAERQQWRRFYEQGISFEETGSYAAAVERYAAAGRIDDTFADLHFRLATCYWNMGRLSEAKAAYVLAREHDTLRFRADSGINDAIRKAASGKREDVMLLDFVQILEENALNGVTGGEHFYEHVHLNFAGNYLLARSLFDTVGRLLTERHGGGLKHVDPPAEAECARYLAYTEWDQYRLADKVLTEFIKRPPFTNQLYHATNVADLQAQLTEIRAAIGADALRSARDGYLWAIDKRPNDWNLHYKLGRLLTEELQDYAGAAEQFDHVKRCVPHFHRGYTAKGQVLAAQDDFTGAIDQYRQAIHRYPASQEACYQLASAYARLERFEEAEQWYRRSIELQPRDATAYNKLAEMLNRQNKIEEAIAVCRRGIAVAPRDAMLRGNLGILLHKKGLKQEAVEELQTALKLDPDSANMRRVLQRIQSSPD